MRQLTAKGARFIRERTVYAQAAQFPKETGYRTIIVARPMPLPNDYLYVSEQQFGFEETAKQHGEALVDLVRRAPGETIQEVLTFVRTQFNRAG